MSLFAKISTYDERSRAWRHRTDAAVDLHVSFGDVLEIHGRPIRSGNRRWLRACAASLVLLPLSGDSAPNFPASNGRGSSCLRVLLSTLEVAALFAHCQLLPLADVITDHGLHRSS